MEIPVLIEPVAGNGFRATASAFPLTAEGATREEALQRLREGVQARLRSGAQLTLLEVTPAENPWLAMAGMRDPRDPIVQEWKQIMAERRREEDTVQEAS